MVIYECVSGSGNFYEDVFGFCCPLKGFRVLVVFGDVRHDGFDELGHAFEDAAA